MYDLFMGYGLPIIWLLGLLLLGAVIIGRFKQGAEMGALLTPLSPDDRLRVALALRAFGEAEKELAKVAWVENRPGNPQVMGLRMELMELQVRAQKLLRES